MVEVEKRGFDTAAFLASADQGTRIDQLARSMFELFAIVKKSSTLPSIRSLVNSGLVKLEVESPSQSTSQYCERPDHQH
jgi:hypothetical protein